MAEKMLFKFAKSGDAEIRFATQDFKGAEYFNVRLWVKNDVGDWVPTKRGLTLNTEQFKSFKRGVEALDQELGNLE